MAEQKQAKDVKLSVENGDLAQHKDAQAASQHLQNFLAKQEDTTKTSVSTQDPPLPAADLPNFTWSGYLQGIGLMFLLLAVLWFLVRLLRRYGRFNFIPRQGSLPRDAFFMEAQMPVGPRKCLMVVRFMQKRFLLAVTEQHISVVTEERLPKGDFEAYVDEAQEEGR